MLLQTGACPPLFDSGLYGESARGYSLLACLKALEKVAEDCLRIQGGGGGVY
jgi:hypothetical protein